MTRFSVIMPLYNKALYVRKAIDSVLEQTFTYWELVIVDDGSTDGSGDVARSYNDSRIIYIHQDNQGVSTTRNNGVIHSHYPYLCFFDADDWWESTFLEEMVGLINRIPHAGIYGSSYWIVKNGKKKKAPIGIDNGFTEGTINYCQVYAKTLCMPLWTGAICMPRSVFDEMNGFKPNLKLGEDFDLWIRVALKHPVVFLNKPLSNYYQDADTNYRGSRQKKYDPESFMAFHFDQFSSQEKANPDLKKLLDRIRVYTLMNFRKFNLFPEKVREEIEKVDFSNVDPIYRFYYHAPFWMVDFYLKTLQSLYLIKKKLIR